MPPSLTMAAEVEVGAEGWGLDGAACTDVEGVGQPARLQYQHTGHIVYRNLGH